jgi:protein-tyrosine phosphatase
MRKLIENEGLSAHIEVDSAGTSAYHEGEPADGRMIGFAKERGYDLTSRSRPFRAPQDFQNFDYILTMDSRNFQDVSDEDPRQEFASKVVPLTQYCRVHKAREVPDPYYQGDVGFQLVLDILEDACANLLTELKKEWGLPR